MQTLSCLSTIDFNSFENVKFFVNLIADGVADGFNIINVDISENNIWASLTPESPLHFDSLGFSNNEIVKKIMKLVK